MIRILLNGALGKMGRMITEMAAAEENMEIVAGVDRFAAGAAASFPLFESMGDDLPEADVVIDFSRPDALDGILAFCQRRGVAAVLATTGYREEDLQKIRDSAETTRIFRSANMSLGINLLMTLSREAAAALKDFDIEIVEAHHNTKVDAPSGTALMLADGINRELLDERHYTFGRHTKAERRGRDEIGIHAIRGGTLVGEHSILYIGQDETVTLRHAAQSRRIYALGTLRAAEYLLRCSSGLYDMQDLLLEQYSVTTLLIDKEQSLMSVWDIPAEARAVSAIFGTLAKEGISVDMISQTAPRGGKLDVSFTLPRQDVRGAALALARLAPETGGEVVKLIIEGRGMERQSGVAAKVLSRLAQAGVGILMITTSETKISLLVPLQDETAAIAALREAFQFS
jgi:4-hydroxy-tetrahydrodipicolinate reductase